MKIDTKQKLSALQQGEFVPRVKRRWHPGFIRVARVLAAAGMQTNEEFAAHFRVSESAILQWRQREPRFDAAIRNGLSELIHDLTDTAIRMAIDERDGQMIRYLLDRRAPGFTPSQKTDHTTGGEPLSALLAQHGELSDREAIDKGLIIDHEAEPSRKSLNRTGRHGPD